MSYTDTPQGQNRGATIATVAVIHAALGYALVSGFGASVVTEVGKTIKATFVEKVEKAVSVTNFRVWPCTSCRSASFSSCSSQRSCRDFPCQAFQGPPSPNGTTTNRYYY